MLWLFCGLIVAGLAGYAVFTSHWIRYVFAHVGGLGVIGLMACWAGAIAKKKGHSYWKAFSLGFALPIVLGIISTAAVSVMGGHGCGGIVSLLIAAVVVLFYSLARKRGSKRKIGTALIG